MHAAKSQDEYRKSVLKDCPLSTPSWSLEMLLELNTLMFHIPRKEFLFLENKAVTHFVLSGGEYFNSICNGWKCKLESEIHDRKLLEDDAMFIL